MARTTETGAGSYDENVKRIEVIQTGLSEFWKDAEGWAPSNVAALLDKSRLDWLPSLATALNHWSKDGDLSPGELILAWANLGSLLEGTLKLFLAVYLADYENDAELLKALNIIYRKGSKKDDPKSPDELTLEPIRQFCKKRKLLKAEELEFLHQVQNYRNLIHAFKDKPLGTTEDFRNAVGVYLTFIAGLATRLPYPGELSFHWLDLAGRIWAQNV
ncbi:hypothetical protein FHS78_001840 [Parvibaculum indicum]|uniref:hypothetical protein n=1 Tax=Parvibaculum indicum TaxID=562969 RepID=UPI001962E094|nr:hypothetical protein [Parvibaculum indicum]NIJ41550.1 hypothetical protein [Parvibaculum indicum]